jgi:hypothetical protein
MTPHSLLAVMLLVQATPRDTATGGRPCRVAVDSMGHFAQVTRGPGDTTSHGGGGVLAHCEGTGTTISADSFAHYSRSGRLDLVGRVQIRDTAMALDARFASYFLRDERLEAHNNVVAVNRRTGSVLRGPNLKYWRAVPGIRDTVEMYATQRPTLEYRQSEGGGGDSVSAEPYVIIGDRIRFKGDDRMWAGGKVTIDRSDFASRSDSMMLDQTRGFGVLVGRPSVEGKGRRGETGEAKSYTLIGTRIELALENREVRLVKAMGNGRATGSDWTLTADTIQLAIADRVLQQTFAWGDSVRPKAVSTLNTIEADSLAIDSPGEVLTETRAFGKALSIGKRDSTTRESDVDWIAGDSLTARFGQEQDTTTPGRSRTRLQHVLARGSARALTHQFETRDTTMGPSINYSRGHQIAVAIRADKIEQVVVAGKADGVHLEPRPVVAADSLRQVSPPPPPQPPRTSRTAVP